MAYEIGFKFNPGTTVYVINRSSYTILKGVIVESKIKTYSRNDTLDDHIVYTVQIKSKKSTLHSTELDTFASYLEAWTILYGVPVPSPTPTVTVTISALY